MVSFVLLPFRFGKVVVTGMIDASTRLRLDRPREGVVNLNLPQAELNSIKKTRRKQEEQQQVRTRGWLTGDGFLILSVWRILFRSAELTSSSIIYIYVHIVAEQYVVEQKIWCHLLIVFVGALLILIIAV